MSVNRRGADVTPPVTEEEDSFDDLWAQTFHGIKELDMSAGSPDAMPTYGRAGPMPVTAAEVLNGRLERNQVAELVELHVDATMLYFKGVDDPVNDATTTQGYFAAEYEVLKDDTVGDTDGNPDAYDETQALRNVENEAGNPQDVGGADALDLNGFYSEIGPASRRMWFGHQTANTGFSDDTNGPGGGGVNSQPVHSVTNFRNQYGRGPIFDSGEALRGMTTLIWGDIQGGSLIRWGIRFRAYWDIFEYEEQPLRESRDDIFD